MEDGITVKKYGGICTSDSLDYIHTDLEKSSGNNLIVVSAVGKTTRMLKHILEVKNKKKAFLDFFDFYVEYIKKENIKNTLKIFDLLYQLEDKMDKNWLLSNAPLFKRDFVLSFGERVTAQILFQSLVERYGHNSVGYISATKMIETFSNYGTGAKIKFFETSKKITFAKDQILEKKFTITEGFIGTNENIRTTLGWNGSDYSAGILAKYLKAIVELHKDEVLHYKDPKESSSPVIGTIDWESYSKIFPKGNNLIFPEVASLLKDATNSPLKIVNFKTGESSLIYSSFVNRELFDSYYSQISHF